MEAFFFFFFFFFFVYIFLLRGSFFRGGWWGGGGRKAKGGREGRIEFWGSVFFVFFKAGTGVGTDKGCREHSTAEQAGLFRPMPQWVTIIIILSEAGSVGRGRARAAVAERER